MSEEKQPLGKVAFDAAYDQWADGLIGSPTVQWAELDDPAQTGWGIIAGTVAAEVVNPTAEDYDHAAEIMRLRGQLDAARGLAETVAGREACRLPTSPAGMLARAILDQLEPQL